MLTWIIIILIVVRVSNCFEEECMEVLGTAGNYTDTLSNTY